MSQNNPAKFKIKVALAALKEALPLAQISSENGVHAVQISRWKKEALEILQEGFSDHRGRRQKEEENVVKELEIKVGQLTMELDWLKKKCT